MKLHIASRTVCSTCTDAFCDSIYIVVVVTIVTVTIAIPTWTQYNCLLFSGIAALFTIFASFVFGSGVINSIDSKATGLKLAYNTIIQ